MDPRQIEHGGDLAHEVIVRHDLIEPPQIVRGRRDRSLRKS
jgi:hypothetical protein